jgi:hypothetical protein
MALPPTHAILALMIGLQSPGKSPYSRIVLEECDEKCQSTPVCDEPAIWCRPPRWSARLQKFVRYESFDEGVMRYLDIADVVRAASEEMVWQPHDTCAAPGTEKPEDGKACEKLRRDRPFVGSSRRLQLLLTTVAYFESTYRRDVHAGTTRGDCDYKTVNGKRVVIDGSCRSHCLGQVKLEGKERTKRGHDKHRIVGLSRGATARCVSTVVDRLAVARNVCVKNRPGTVAHPACILGVYGGVGSWKSDPRIKKRYKTYLDLARAEPKLSKRVRKLLGLDSED